MVADRRAARTPDRPAPAVPRPPAGAPPQVTMGLLDYITAHSMDEDYAHAAERREERGRPRQVNAGVAALVILGIFGLLVATAAVQTSRNEVAAQSGREELITQIEARSARLDARRSRIVEMRREIDVLQNRFLEASAQGRALSARLERLGVSTGQLAVTGPGVRVVVDDAPDATSAQNRVLDKDLQKLVNALWASGAEAIAVNGQRITNLTAIRHAGTAITVNFRSLSPPYTVNAIGDQDTMPARFVETRHGAEWLDVQVAGYGLQFEMTPEDSLRLPPAPANRLTVRHATSPEETP